MSTWEQFSSSSGHLCPKGGVAASSSHGNLRFSPTKSHKRAFGEKVFVWSGVLQHQACTAHSKPAGWNASPFLSEIFRLKEVCFLKGNEIGGNNLRWELDLKCATSHVTCESGTCETVAKWLSVAHSNCYFFHTFIQGSCFGSSFVLSAIGQGRVQCCFLWHRILGFQAMSRLGGFFLTVCLLSCYEFPPSAVPVYSAHCWSVYPVSKPGFLFHPGLCENCAFSAPVCSSAGTEFFNEFPADSFDLSKVEFICF